MVRSTVVLIMLLFAPNAMLAVAQAASKKIGCAQIKRLSFSNWQEWTPILNKPVRSVGHNDNWVGIFVDDLAKATYLAAGAPYPECARIVKPIYRDAKGTSVRKLTIMVKMPAGYDTENGDWWYAKADPSGSRIGRHGRLDDCISCHKQAAETDYLFSRDVMNAKKE
jgi:hypothetical protein